MKTEAKKIERDDIIRMNFVTLREFRLVARAIEAAHGIKENT